MKPGLEPEGRVQPGGHKIVVVDDNRDFANSLAAILREAGHDVRVAYRGQQGIEQIVDFKPAIAFIDISMPDVTGYDVARELRRRDAHETLVLVAVTGWGEEDADRMRSAVAGFDLHVVKPLDPSQLPGLFERVEARRQMKLSLGPR